MFEYAQLVELAALKKQRAEWREVGAEGAGVLLVGDGGGEALAEVAVTAAAVEGGVAV